MPAKKPLSVEIHNRLLQAQTRRQFLGGSALGLGSLFLSTLGGKALATPEAAAGGSRIDFSRDPRDPLAPLPPQFAAKARRIIFMQMVGGPSQLEMFNYRPELSKFDGKECPPSFLVGKRFEFISGVPKLMGSRYPFHQAGKSGAWISDRLPHLERRIDDLCVINSMRTETFNHEPGELMLQTGNIRLGNPSMGAWVTYGLGSENRNLPGFIVLASTNLIPAGKPLWGAGFLPSIYQGVECRSDGDPVLFLNNPNGVSRSERRRMLDALDEVNRRAHARIGNPETLTRISQYEMAFRMQVEASEVMDIRHEPESVLKRYGATPGKTSFANNCLLARRLAERNVRFIQLYHGNWDHHGGTEVMGIKGGLAKLCRDIDQPIAALLEDLKLRGLMDDTLIVWGGEFGRTPIQQNSGGRDPDPNLAGRDHHPWAYTMWMAGAGVKPGLTYGETDEFGFDAVKNPVEIRDLHATMLYLMGFDHHKLNYSFQGLDQKLTGVHPARVVTDILA